MDLRISKKIALVSGATAGIGLAIARRLSEEGASVAVTGRDQNKLDAALRTLLPSKAGPPVGVLADLSTAEGVGALLSQVPKVDILVNNLGIYESKQFAEISDADWARYFEINVMSGVRLARAYFPQMLSANWGRIIFVSSETGLAVAPDMIHYAMTKSAQLSISRGLAGLTRSTGVTVNSVLPGPTRSDGIVKFIKSVSKDPTLSGSVLETEFFTKFRPSSLLQRMVEPEEVANLVAYLASPLASATNGAAVRVEGGLIPTLA